MANHKSVIKRIRQAEVRTERNKSRVSRIRTFIRKFEEAFETGDKAATLEALKAVQSELHSGVSKGVMHRNTAARKISRLTNRFKMLAS